MQLTPWSLSARPSRQPGRLGCSRPCPRPRPRRPPSAGAHHPAPGLGTARRERGRAGATGAPCPSGTPGAAASLFSHLSPVKATFQLAGSMLTWGGSHLPEVMKSLCRDEAAPAPRWRGFLPPPHHVLQGEAQLSGRGPRGKGGRGGPSSVLGKVVSGEPHPWTHTPAGPSSTARGQRVRDSGSRGLGRPLTPRR